jgi:hypothetical protein
MRTVKSRWLLCSGGAALALALVAPSGCASPQRIQEAAYRHELSASELRARGDYQGAYEEEQAAAKQRAKAAERERWWY